MDVSRARQILNANIEIEVHYNNNPVWIKSIDESSGIASVENMRNNSNIQVPISELREIKPKM